jgi:hypothetical protein
MNQSVEPEILNYLLSKSTPINTTITIFLIELLIFIYVIFKIHSRKVTLVDKISLFLIPILFSIGIGYLYTEQINFIDLLDLSIYFPFFISTFGVSLFLILGLLFIISSFIVLIISYWIVAFILWLLFLNKS